MRKMWYRHRLVKAIIKAYEKDKIIEQGGAYKNCLILLTNIHVIEY